MSFKKPHYLLRLLVQSIVSSLTTGVVFGWVSVVLMMDQDGLFYHLCQTSNSTNPANIIFNSQSEQIGVLDNDFHSPQIAWDGNNLLASQLPFRLHSDLSSAILSTISHYYDPSNIYKPNSLFIDSEKQRLPVHESKEVVSSRNVLPNDLFSFNSFSASNQHSRDSLKSNEVPSSGKRQSCAARQGYLNTIYVVGVSANAASYIFWGFLLDMIGPRMTASISSVSVIAGNFVFSISNDSNRAWWHLGMVLIGIGGIGIHLPSFHLANLVPPQNRGLASSIFPGMFNVSGMMWAILAVFNATGISINRIFGGFTIVVFAASFALFWIQSWKATPSDYHQHLVAELEKRTQQEAEKGVLNTVTSEPDKAQEMTNFTSPDISSDDYPNIMGIYNGNVRDNRDGNSTPEEMDGVDILPSLPDELLSEDEKAELEKNQFGKSRDQFVVRLDPLLSKPAASSGLNSNVSLLSQVPDARYARWKYIPNLQHLEFKDQILSVYFIWTLIFVASHLTRNSFWQGTLNSQFAYIDTSIGKHLSHTYSIIVTYGPLIVLLTFPLGGMIIDRRGLPFMITIGTVLQLLYSFLAMIPNLNLQLVTAIAYFLGRTYIMTAYFSCVAMVCGFKTFGKVSGLAMAATGIVNFTSIPLNYLVNNQLKGNYFWANFIEFLWCIPLAYYPYYLWSTGRRQALEKEDSLELARISQISKEQQKELESFARRANQRAQARMDQADNKVDLDI